MWPLFLVLAEPAALPIEHCSNQPDDRCEKAPVFRLRLLIMVEVEIFELPTRTDFWHWRNPLLYQLSIAATMQTTDVKKPQSFD
ncbi:hypothetical protein C1M59_13930 [Vibrio diazotrophicus]|nr:hypothetical protein C1M59_13930 [Vibrio diazotrophicus]